jgi:hypothetical protein
VYEVAITYTNGSNVLFYAQEIDIDFEPDNLAGSTNRYGLIQKLLYKDVDGEDAILYLKPGQVSGIVVRVDAGQYGLTVHAS